MITLNGKQVLFGQFPNGEVNLPVPTENERNKVVLRYREDADLFRLMLLRDCLRNPSDLHIMYFPYSRMDRVSKEYVLTLQSVADYINWMEWDSVTIYEPHSDVTPALIAGAYVVEVIPILMNNLNVPEVNFQVFFPDAGAQKRYSDTLGFHPDLELVGFKKRDFSTGRIQEIKILGDLKYSTVVIVDDLCSKGGTFVMAAEKLRAMGFKRIYLVVAHCENTIYEGKMFSSGLIDHVFTTDSILDDYDERKGITVYPLFDLTRS